MKLEHICLAVLTGCGAFLLIEGGLLLRQTRLKTVPELTQAVTEIRRTALIAGVTASNLQKASDSWQTKQNALADRATAATSTLNSDLTQLAQLASTASSLLSEQQSSLNALETTAGQSISSTASQLAALRTDLKPSLDNFAIASAELSEGLSKTLPAIQLSAQNTADTTANAAATTKDVRDYVHRELAPIHGFWNGVKGFIFELAGPLAEVATSIK